MSSSTNRLSHKLTQRRSSLVISNDSTIEKKLRLKDWLKSRSTLKCACAILLAFLYSVCVLELSQRLQKRTSRVSSTPLVDWAPPAISICERLTDLLYRCGVFNRKACEKRRPHLCTLRLFQQIGNTQRLFKLASLCRVHEQIKVRNFVLNTVGTAIDSYDLSGTIRYMNFGLYCVYFTPNSGARKTEGINELLISLQGRQMKLRNEFNKALDTERLGLSSQNWLLLKHSRVALDYLFQMNDDPLSKGRWNHTLIIAMINQLASTSKSSSTALQLVKADYNVTEALKRMIYQNRIPEMMSSFNKRKQFGQNLFPDEKLIEFESLYSLHRPLFTKSLVGRRYLISMKSKKNQSSKKVFSTRNRPKNNKKIKIAHNASALFHCDSSKTCSIEESQILRIPFMDGDLSKIKFKPSNNFVRKLTVKSFSYLVDDYNSDNAFTIAYLHAANRLPVSILNSIFHFNSGIAASAFRLLRVRYRQKPWPFPWNDCEEYEPFQSQQRCWEACWRRTNRAALLSYSYIEWENSVQLDTNFVNYHSARTLPPNDFTRKQCQNQCLPDCETEHFVPIYSWLDKNFDGRIWLKFEEQGMLIESVHRLEFYQFLSHLTCLLCVLYGCRLGSCRLKSKNNLKRNFQTNSCFQRSQKAHRASLEPVMEMETTLNNKQCFGGLVGISAQPRLVLRTGVMRPSLSSSRLSQGRLSLDQLSLHRLSGQSSFGQQFNRSDSIVNEKIKEEEQSDCEASFHIPTVNTIETTRKTSLPDDISGIGRKFSSSSKFQAKPQTWTRRSTVAHVGMTLESLSEKRSSLSLSTSLRTKPTIRLLFKQFVLTMLILAFVWQLIELDSLEQRFDSSDTDFGVVIENEINISLCFRLDHFFHISHSWYRLIRHLVHAKFMHRQLVQQLGGKASSAERQHLRAMLIRLQRLQLTHQEKWMPKCLLKHLSPDRMSEKGTNKNRTLWTSRLRWENWKPWRYLNKQERAYQKFKNKPNPAVYDRQTWGLTSFFGCNQSSLRKYSPPLEWLERQTLQTLQSISLSLEEIVDDPLNFMGLKNPDFIYTVSDVAYTPHLKCFLLLVQPSSYGNHFLYPKIVRLRFHIPVWRLLLGRQLYEQQMDFLLQTSYLLRTIFICQSRLLSPFGQWLKSLIIPSNYIRDHIFGAFSSDLSESSESDPLPDGAVSSTSFWAKLFQSRPNPNCIDYSHFNTDDNYTCTCRQDCINYCVARRMIHEYSLLPGDQPYIQYRYGAKLDGKQLRFDYDDRYSIAHRAPCEVQHSMPDCVVDVYRSSETRIPLYHSKKELRINLRIKKRVLIERSIQSPLEIAQRLLAWLSIILGFRIPTITNRLWDTLHPLFNIDLRMIRWFARLGRMVFFFICSTSIFFMYTRIMCQQTLLEKRQLQPFDEHYSIPPVISICIPLSLILRWPRNVPKYKLPMEMRFLEDTLRQRLKLKDQKMKTPSFEDLSIFFGNNSLNTLTNFSEHKNIPYGQWTNKLPIFKAYTIQFLVHSMPVDKAMDLYKMTKIYQIGRSHRNHDLTFDDLRRLTHNLSQVIDTITFIQRDQNSKNGDPHPRRLVKLQGFDVELLERSTQVGNLELYVYLFMNNKCFAFRLLHAWKMRDEQLLLHLKVRRSDVMISIHSSPMLMSRRMTSIAQLGLKQFNYRMRLRVRNHMTIEKCIQLIRAYKFLHGAELLQRQILHKNGVFSYWLPVTQRLPSAKLEQNRTIFESIFDNTNKNFYDPNCHILYDVMQRSYRQNSGKFLDIVLIPSSVSLIETSHQALCWVDLILFVTTSLVFWLDCNVWTFTLVTLQKSIKCLKLAIKLVTK